MLKTRYTNDQIKRDIPINLLCGWAIKAQELKNSALAAVITNWTQSFSNVNLKGKKKKKKTFPFLPYEEPLRGQHMLK